MSRVNTYYLTMDSMQDLEQLRNSVIEQDIPSAIGQVHQWLDTHGATILSTNQRLPFTYIEAETIRKEHEKVELKCMTFLAFYSKINLKNIPEQYQEMREDMDIKIHKFSEHIKARRHIVVSFYTFFRHFEQLQEKLSDLQNEDLSNLPDSIEEITTLIADFDQNITNSLKRLSHLKVDGDRVKTTLNTIVSLNDSPSFNYIDRSRINESKNHIDVLLQEIEEDVTRIFESQRILELELKIEAKMMLIEDDITRCCGWLQKLEQKLVDKYNDKVVGMATVENDLLYKNAEELVNKMKVTKDYGTRLMDMYDQLCLQFTRDTSRGQTSKDKLDELWQLADLISTEAINRLAKAGKLFYGLDRTLDKVEDMLLSINKDKENNVSKDEIVDKYRPVRDEALGELQNMIQSSKELFSKLRYDLFNKKIKSTTGMYIEAEQTEDMVKMKIFTIRVKLKELDRYISPDNIPEIIQETVAKTNSEPVFVDLNEDDLLANINKYLKFLKSSRLNWESTPLPVTFNQSVKALQEHEDISNRSEQYWRNIQGALSSKELQSQQIQKLLSVASRDKNMWDAKWTEHLDEHLNPRYQFLKKLKDFNNDIDMNQAILDDLINKPNHTLALTRDVRKDLAKMKSQLPMKEQDLNELYEEEINIHRTDFNGALSVSEDKLVKYRNRLETFNELEQLIEEILEFLPELSLFKKEWQVGVTNLKNDPSELSKLRNEADAIKGQISSYDTDRLQRLATETYGNSKRVEWLIDELQAEFLLPEVREEFIKPTTKSMPQMATFDVLDGPAKESTVTVPLHSTTDLNFELNAMPRRSKDQYNVQWYKDNTLIDPSKDQRMTPLSDSRKDHLSLRIENCEFSDAGKYWCKVNDPQDGMIGSFPINLNVSPKKLQPQNNVIPLFDEEVLAGRDDPLTLELKLNGFRFAPDTDLRRNNTLINVNQRDCPWTRVSNNTSVEFSHPAVTDNDRGPYEFVIDNKVVAKTTIVIGDAPKLFQHHFKETAVIGEPLSITIPTANIAGKDNQKVIWRKDDVEITPESGKFNWRVNRNGDPVFEIAQVRASHAGIYSCEVFNEFGRTSAQLVLDAMSDDKHSPSKFNDANVGPTVEEITANAGESVTLAIDYLPSKHSEIVWTKEGKPLTTTDPRVKISNDGDSRCVLHLNSSRVDDSGLYTATVKGTNRKHSINLEIIPPAPGPIIEKFPQSVRVKVNDPLNIECLVRSSPACDNIQWTLTPSDGSAPRNIFGNAKCKLSTKAAGSTTDNLQRLNLCIDHAGRSDAGEYAVRCENSRGWSSVKIPVTIIDDAQNKKRPPTFVQSLNKEIVTSGDEPVLLKCKVIGNPFPIVKWTKNGRDVVPSDFIKTRNMGEVHEMSILNPRANDSGTYEAVASNSEGTEKSHCLLKVLDPKDNAVFEEDAVPHYVSKQQTAPDELDSLDQTPQRTQLIFSNTVVRSPPQFVTTFTDQIVQEGDDVDLKCCLIGQPEPLIYWSYNTHLLKNPRFQTSRQLDEYTLSMRNLKEEDSGRYSMTAENSSGLATCSALVIVDKNNDRGKSLDKTQYKTNSKPMNTTSQFPCHTTLSHSMNPSLSDESRIMQVSPRGWDDNKLRSSSNSPRPPGHLSEIDRDSLDNLDFKKSKTKTIKTYHYSGPSGVDLPGIGFIPKNPVPANFSSTSSDETMTHAVFVPGINRKAPIPLPREPMPDLDRFSYVESSECDYPL